MTTSDELLELDELDDDELFEELGRQLLSGTSAAGPLDGSGFRSYGRDWFQTKLPLLREGICKNRVISAMYDKRYEDVITSVSLFADVSKVVEEKLGYAGSTAVTMLILRLGLRRFCADHLSE